MQTWDEFHPTLYQLKITMKSGKNETDVKVTHFGMRDFTIKTYFYVNDRKIVLRGTVENCVFPLRDTLQWMLNPGKGFSAFAAISD